MVRASDSMKNPNPLRNELTPKRDLMGIAKSIDLGQAAQCAQADHGRNFSILADFLCTKR